MAKIENYVQAEEVCKGLRPDQSSKFEDFNKIVHINQAAHTFNDKLLSISRRLRCVFQFISKADKSKNTNE